MALGDQPVLDFPMWLSQTGRTVAINNAAASGDLTIHTTTTGTKFVVYMIFVQAEGATDLTFKSGSTSISGAIAYAINAEAIYGGSVAPIFMGRTKGDNFVMNVSAAVQVNGFAVIGELLL